MTKPLTERLKSLIGKKFNSKLATEIESLAKTDGFEQVQVRECGYFFDCMYKSTRLQVHVDENQQITNLCAG